VQPRLAIAVACGLVLGPAAGGSPAVAAPGPAAFSTHIDNAYMPLSPGSRWVYRATSGDGSTQRIVVKVMPETKLIANGVTARVVRDTATEKGHVVEDTYDWYAQDRRGNVWYLGEDTKAYESGKVSTAGSWEAGVNGARAGKVMPAHPRAGLQYRQEYLAGEAEDHARVLSLDDQAEVPAGHYRNALLTKEWTPLEPDGLEYKLYARGVGQVLALTVSGGWEREELISFNRR
jgi:hypothetical protein